MAHGAAGASGGVGAAGWRQNFRTKILRQGDAMDTVRIASMLYSLAGNADVILTSGLSEGNSLTHLKYTHIIIARFEI